MRFTRAALALASSTFLLTGCGLFGGEDESGGDPPGEPVNAGRVEPGEEEVRETLASQDVSTLGTELHIAVHDLVRGGEAVEIDGYTGSEGADSRNQPLSEERAGAVEGELSRLTDAADITFEVEGHGSANPVAPDEIDGEDIPEGREKNRRVEIRFPRRPALP